MEEKDIYNAQKELANLYLTLKNEYTTNVIIIYLFI